MTHEVSFSKTVHPYVYATGARHENPLKSCPLGSIKEKKPFGIKFSKFPPQKNIIDLNFKVF
jgi:hypothetical protein